MLPDDPFETYLAASAIINVNSPDHGRSASDTVRFRGPPFVSSETNKLVVVERNNNPYFTNPNYQMSSNRGQIYLNPYSPPLRNTNYSINKIIDSLL